MERDNTWGCATVHELALPLYRGSDEEKHNLLTIRTCPAGGRQSRYSEMSPCHQRTPRRFLDPSGTSAALKCVNGNLLSDNNWFT